MSQIPRIVLDTNVLISSLIGVGKPRQLLDKALNEYYLIISDDILREMTGVMKRSKFYISSVDLANAISRLRALGRIVTISSGFRVVDDPDDDMIINTAIDGKADYIVSGDDHLLRLGEFRGIKIVTISKMLEIL